MSTKNHQGPTKQQKIITMDFRKGRYGMSRYTDQIVFTLPL